METYSDKLFDQLGIQCNFVQDNHSFSRAPYTLRGLHFQRPPCAQAKLVRCTNGRIFDVAVDLRSGSPTYGLWAAAELSAENGCQLFIPVGFAHGFLTLEPDCEVCYKCSDHYAPDLDAGIRWDDPQIAVKWPVPNGLTPVLSPKDAIQPLMSSFDAVFDYDGLPLEQLC